MNTKLENTTFSAAAVIISLFIVSTAFATSPTDEVRTETVKFQDLNLQSEAGLAALYGRIHSAARRVCEQPGESALVRNGKCVEDAETAAIMKVNLPTLSAYYQKKTGRAVPMLAAKGQ